MLRRGIVGPLDLVIGTEHQRGVAQRGGGLPELLEVGGELLLAPLLAVTQPVDAAAHLFEDPGRVRRLDPSAMPDPGRESDEVAPLPVAVEERAQP